MKSIDSNNFLYIFSSLSHTHTPNLHAGHRVNQEAVPLDKTQRGLVGRMFGAVSSGVKIGGFMLDSVHQRTNEVIQSALH